MHTIQVTTYNLLTKIKPCQFREGLQYSETSTFTDIEIVTFLHARNIWTKAKQSYTMHANCVLLVPLLAALSTGFLLDDDTVAGLLASLRREKEARTTLEVEVAALRADLLRIDASHEACKLLFSK